MGGLGIYTEWGDGTFTEFKSGYSNTTVNRMELRAAILAISSIDKSTFHKVHLVTDSQYVESAINEGKIELYDDMDYEGVKNADLWSWLHSVIEERPLMKLIVTHINGHQTDLDDPLVIGNNIADELADYKDHEEYQKDLDELLWIPNYSVIFAKKK